MVSVKGGSNKNIESGGASTAITYIQRNDQYIHPPYNNETMNNSSFSVRRPVASGLTIRPPSPNHLIPPKSITPTNPNQSRPYAASPTYSTRSSSTQGNVGGRRGSNETSNSGMGPPVPAKGDKDKRLPQPPFISPGKRGEKGYAGAYDNKLVSCHLLFYQSTS
jgi:hypothetical protein